MAAMEVHDSLPYIDNDISSSEREKALALISRELPRSHAQTLHPSLPASVMPQFSEMMKIEIEGAGSRQGQPRDLAEGEGIDLSRYEAPEEPTSDQSINDPNAWKALLRQAYTASTYLRHRQTNLVLLEEFGKNAWLIGNSELEGIHSNLEKELAEVKSQTEAVNQARKQAQESSRGELIGLEETWQRAVGRNIEVQIATEQKRRELEARRNGAT